MDVKETAKEHWILTMLGTATVIVSLLAGLGGLSPSITPAFMSDIHGVLVKVADLDATRVTQQITDLTIMIANLTQAQAESGDPNFLKADIARQTELLRQLYVKQDRLTAQAGGQ